ncbi:MAG: Cof-type HAD-IIB family hydrolase [Syntrophomonadaceae bacterium]|jgi:Cof subfamily protein (haloacid dehalogenase superfamily)
MAIKLVALDLDDTLLDNSLKISQECVNTIREVRAGGVIVTLATGRAFKSALPYARQLDIDVPLITYQGAWVKNSLSGEELYNRPVPRDLAREVMEFFRSRDVHYHTYFNDNLTIESLSEEARYYIGIAGVEPVMVPSLVDALDEGEALKILAVSFAEEQLLAMESELQERFGSNLHITRSKPYFLEIMDARATKADALQVVAGRYGIKRNEVLAVGDSYNDLAMIKWAGIGVAMGNACEEIKNLADFVTSSNEEEGVAEALQRLILKR